MGALSVWHWLIVLLVILLLFGPKKISEMGKGLGQGLRNFRSGLTEDDPSELTSRTPKANNTSREKGVGAAKET